ncbi:MAG TPA: alpha/beta hydrolase [Terriglobales bacterium]|nr:alpha/beta hydrolase [Terriglobales bacterium]
MKAKVMRSILILLPLLMAGLDPVHAQEVSGDWQGTLSAGNLPLRLVLHIRKGADGTLQATLDSVDQGANRIPVSSITLQDAKLNLAVDAVHGTYEGRVAADGNTIAGTWTQGQALPLEFERAPTAVSPEPKPAKPSDMDGVWMGRLDTGAVKLRVVFHIVNTEDGLIATIDSPDQGMRATPASAVTRDGASLKVEAKSLSGAFEGRMADDRLSIAGTWTQRGRRLPLVLRPVKDLSEGQQKRPQNPAKPYPYRQEEVSFENRVQNVTLAATLTLPPGRPPFAAVLLITGSGPQDRDESLLGHKPFLVLSDYLTRQGIAVLRADDRGVAQSTGNFATATTADFATDTEAGVAYLKTRAEIDPNKIGLIGHSEGGVIAPMVAARNTSVAFIVMMAGPGVPGDQILPAQSEAMAVASGKNPEDAAKDAARQREVIALVESEKNGAVLEKELKEKMAGRMPEAQVGAQIHQITSPWFRYFLTYDPTIALRRLSCPVLAINGGKDTQVLPKQNLPPVRKALQEAGNQHFEVDELPGLNHLFQTAKTGAPAEYAEIEETISPIALEKIASWILQR